MVPTAQVNLLIISIDYSMYIYNIYYIFNFLYNDLDYDHHLAIE
jgi:hypothetical protein